MAALVAAVAARKHGRAAIALTTVGALAISSMIMASLDQHASLRTSSRA